MKCSANKTSYLESQRIDKSILYISYIVVHCAQRLSLSVMQWENFKNDNIVLGDQVCPHIRAKIFNLKSKEAPYIGYEISHSHGMDNVSY